jgi:hypothetical protein
VHAVCRHSTRSRRHIRTHKYPLYLSTIPFISKSNCDALKGFLKKYNHTSASARNALATVRVYLGHMTALFDMHKQSRVWRGVSMMDVFLSLPPHAVDNDLFRIEQLDVIGTCMHMPKLADRLVAA